MGCITDRRLWPNKNISYWIDTRFSIIQAREIRSALTEIERISTLRFSESPNAINFIFFKKSNKNSSKVGYRGINEFSPYTHTINLDQKYPINIFVVVHEVFHSLGLEHEQCRKDRDDYVSIKFDHITKGAKNNFEQEASTDFGPYDYDSLMHYRSNDFAISWRINRPVIGHQSKSVPALSVFNGQLHMVHTGASSKKLWHSWFDGADWTAPVEIIGEFSKASPALAEFGGMLHMTHIGSESNKIWHSMYDGTNWSSSVEVSDHLSRNSPALAILQNKLCMIHIGEESNKIWYSQFDGSIWSNDTEILNQKSNLPVSLATYSSKIHMFYKGEFSNKLYHSEFDGTSWSNTAEIPRHKSNLTPSVAAFNNQVHIIHKGEQSKSIWHSKTTLSTSIFNWEAPEKNSNQTSQASPVINEFNGALFLFHLGEDTKTIYFSQFDPNLKTIETPTSCVPISPNLCKLSHISIGQRTNISSWDQKAINFMYP